MKHVQPPLLVNEQIKNTAAQVCHDALTISRIKSKSTWAAVCWRTDCIDSPLELFAAHQHTRRRLLWRDREWQLALGISATTRYSGSGRFFGIAEDAAQWRNRMCFKRCDATAPDLPFFIESSFEEQSPLDSHWGSSLAPCRMIIPQRLFWQRDDQAWCYSCCEVRPDSDHADLLQQLIGPLPTRPVLEAKAWPALDTTDFKEMVEEALSLLQSGAMRKIVLARAVDEQLQQRKPLEDIIGSLHQAADAQSTCYAYDLDDGACFVGATPETLFSLDNNLCITMALAGSRKRGKDSAEDQALAIELMNSTKERKEHQLVVEHIAQILKQRDGEVTLPSSPEIRRLQKIQHLETDLTCYLQDANAFDLLAAINPTPAVCGLPVSAARQFIKRHEGLHRGLYAGAIGYHTPDQSHFIVPLRGGIVRGQNARIFAGAGLVETSVASAEEEETETKLSLMRQALHG